MPDHLRRLDENLLLAGLEDRRMRLDLPVAVLHEDLLVDDLGDRRDFLGLPDAFLDHDLLLHGAVDFGGGDVLVANVRRLVLDVVAMVATMAVALRGRGAGDEDGRAKHAADDSEGLLDSHWSLS